MNNIFDGLSQLKFLRLKFLLKDLLLKTLKKLNSLKILKAFYLTSLCFLTGCMAHADAGFSRRCDVQAFIQKVSLRDHFTVRQLNLLFDRVKPRPVFIQSASRPHEKTLTWQTYRAIFLTPLKIQKGVKFWQTHSDSLQLACQKYGVDPAIIVAIIGIETEYGKYLGQYRIIDSLSTLAFNYPQRQKFFQSELEQYLLLARELKDDPLNLYGSYAGAAGLPQFMPSSYRNLAVSSSAARLPDLWSNADDAVLSTAHYLQRHHWQPGQPAALRIKIAAHQSHAKQFGSEQWRLYPNFGVIKSYNNSDFYAMAVYQFSEAVKNALKNKR